MFEDIFHTLGDGLEQTFDQDSILENIEDLSSEQSTSFTVLESHNEDISGLNSDLDDSMVYLDQSSSLNITVQLDVTIDGVDDSLSPLEDDLNLLTLTEPVREDSVNDNLNDDEEPCQPSREDTEDSPITGVWSNLSEIAKKLSQQENREFSSSLEENSFTPDRFSVTANAWGNPIEDANFWQQQQGQNTCAVVAQIGVLESITGVHISESEACRIATENGWFDAEIGTRPGDVGKFLNQLGIPTQQTYDATLTDIAQALEQGDKIIVGLDAHEIWQPLRDPITNCPLEQPDAGHAVWVIGIEKTADNSVKILLNDSGTPAGCMSVIEADDFLNAWDDYGNFLVTVDAPELSTQVSI